MSTGGSEATGTPGGGTRRGPRTPNGPACDVKTGSVMSTVDAVRIRNVEWPTNVSATWPGATLAGGGAWSPAGAVAGHGVFSRVRIHLMTSPSERSAERSVLKKRSPSQWSETGNRDTQNLYTSAVIRATSLLF